MKAAVAAALAAWALAEGLGAAGALRPGALALGWAGAALAALAWAAGAPARPAQAPPSPGAAPAEARLALALALALAVAGAASALLLPHGNLDAQLYHLPRVEQWLQAGSLAHFPASYDLQDFYPPGAETLLLQLRALSGGDRLLGLLQWAAWGLAGLAVWDSVRSIGGGRRARALGLLAWLGTPMAVLQMPTCQNDLVAAAAVATGAALLLRHRRDPGAGWETWCAAALGAALWIKGSNYLFVLPLALWLAVLLAARGRTGPGRAAALAALLLLPSLPHWSRNAALSASVLGPASDHIVLGAGPSSFLSHALKGLGDELRFPFPGYNEAVHRAVAGLHGALGLPMERAGWIWGGLGYDQFMKDLLYWNEDSSGAPLQVLLAFTLLAVALARRRLRGAAGALAAAATGGLALYLLLVRYNPWDTRLHLPCLALLAPLIGLGLAGLPGRAWAWSAAAGFVLFGLAPSAFNGARPWAQVPRSSYAQRWDRQPGVHAGRAAARLSGSIGILTSERSQEYGLWRGAHEVRPEARLQHLSASPATAPLLHRAPWSEFRPGVIVAGRGTASGDRLDWGGRRWRLIGCGPAYCLYAPADPAP